MKRIVVLLLFILLLTSTASVSALSIAASSDSSYVPIKNAAHLASSGMEVSANPSGGDHLSNLNDGNVLTHASTQAGTAQDPG